MVVLISMAPYSGKSLTCLHGLRGIRQIFPHRIKKLSENDEYEKAARTEREKRVPEANCLRIRTCFQVKLNYN